MRSIRQYSNKNRRVKKMLRRDKWQILCSSTTLATTNAPHHALQPLTYHVAYASTTSGVSHSCNIISKSAPVTAGAAFSVSSAARPEDSRPKGRQVADGPRKASACGATSASRRHRIVPLALLRLLMLAVIIANCSLACLIVRPPIAPALKVSVF